MMHEDGGPVQRGSTNPGPAQLELAKGDRGCYIWRFFLRRGGSGFLLGFLRKQGVLDVVNLWCECGVSRGGCGVLDVTFWGSKKVPRF
jgi:hypothetical protein